MRQLGYCSKTFYKDHWERYKSKPDAPFRCFRAQLEVVTDLIPFQRFATVPKNNLVDRSIGLEPICNMLVQRSIGTGLREALRAHTGIDLDHAAAKHRVMIRDPSRATIDLKSASDRIHLDLVRFLFPSGVCRLIEQARCPYVLTLSGDLRRLNKVCSMGNGFTFDVMSCILASVALDYDSQASVFGDDIIVANEAALGLCRDLNAAGFLINYRKTCINSRFRESCGAVYHDDFGYIVSFDFRWPKTIHDVAVVCNKAYVLGQIYPSFKKLHGELLRCIPGVLRGPPPSLLEARWDDGRDLDHSIADLSSYVWALKPGRGLESVDRNRVAGMLADYQLLDQPLRFFYGWKWASEAASPLRKHLKISKSLGKYFMYLHGGRKVPDTIAGRGSWQRVTYVQVGRRAFRMKSLVQSKDG